MENETIEPDDARMSGFVYSRDMAMKETGWSNATLGRKMAQMTQGTHYVLVRGKTKPTPVFSQAILQMAGIAVGVAETLEETGLAKASIEKISQSSHNHLKKISDDNFAVEFTNALILPHKIYVTLAEAKLLTGFPMSELFKFSELKFGRRVIKKSRLEEI